MTNNPLILRIGKVAIATLAATAAVILLRQLGFLEGFELQAFDHFLRWQPTEEEEDRILVVGITEDDLTTLNASSVPDGVMAEAIEELQANDARVIALDVLRDIPVGEGREELLEEFAESNVVVACQMNEAESPGVAPPPDLSEEQVGFADLPIDIDNIQRRGFLFAIPALAETEYENEHLCNDPNADLYSLAFATATLYLEEEEIEPEFTEDDKIKLGSATIEPLTDNAGGYVDAYADGFQILIDYPLGAKPKDLVSLGDVVAGKVDSKLIRDRAVLIGYTAQSVQDIFETPFSATSDTNPLMPGVIVHGQIVSQLLGAALDDRPLIWYAPEFGEWLWILAWATVGGIVASLKTKPWLILIIDGVAIALLWGICYSIFQSGGWLPLIPPALALIGSSVIVKVIANQP
ncbi:MAG: CHASE2 domain-containing protein [Spirulinaceae cyanobacterium]